MVGVVEGCSHDPPALWLAGFDFRLAAPVTNRKLSSGLARLRRPIGGREARSEHMRSLTATRSGSFAVRIGYQTSHDGDADRVHGGMRLCAHRTNGHCAGCGPRVRSQLQPLLWCIHQIAGGGCTHVERWPSTLNPTSDLNRGSSSGFPAHGWACGPRILRCHSHGLPVSRRGPARGRRSVLCRRNAPLAIIGCRYFA